MPLTVIKPRIIGATFDGGDLPLSLILGTTKVKVGPIPFSCTITGLNITADASGSVTFTVKKCVVGSYPGSLTDITSGNNAVLSSAAVVQNTTLTGWTRVLAQNDVLEFALSAVDGVIKQISIRLSVV